MVGLNIFFLLYGSLYLKEQKKGFTNLCDDGTEASVNRTENLRFLAFLFHRPVLLQKEHLMCHLSISKFSAGKKQWEPFT